MYDVCQFPHIFTQSTILCGLISLGHCEWTEYAANHTNHQELSLSWRLHWCWQVVIMTACGPPVTPVFALSAGPRPSATKNWAGPASFPFGPASFSSFSCLKIFKDEFRAGKFWNLNAKTVTLSFQCRKNEAFTIYTKRAMMSGVNNPSSFLWGTRFEESLSFCLMAFCWSDWFFAGDLGPFVFFWDLTSWSLKGRHLAHLRYSCIRELILGP